MTPYNLFLDDLREPWSATYCPIIQETGKFTGSVNGLYLDRKWVIVRSVQEFRDMLVSGGMPDLVSFDHDLAWEHYQGAIDENTGVHAATFLCDYANSHDLPLPKWFVHSMNPVGSENIASVLRSAVRIGYVKPRCMKPEIPSGWWCKRAEGHDGPCAALPIDGSLIPH